MIAKGRSIWVEGCDGSGKTTLCHALADEVTKLTGQPCVTIAFPSRASAPGALIRDVFEGKQKVIPEAMMWLFIAEGVDMESQINAWLNEGRSVIVDRHTAFSQLIYQTELHTKDEVEQASAPAKFRKPDMVYVLDIAPEVAIARREARGEARNKLYEPEDIEKLKAMRLKYLKVAWDSGATIINSSELTTKDMVDTIIDDLKRLKDPVLMSSYLDDVFGPGGYLARHFDGYEIRPSQTKMASVVDAVIRDGGKAIIEGPCGSGKSMIYSVPAIHHIMESRENCEDIGAVIIVTENLALQEQLSKKDLPMLAGILPWPFTYAQLKGRGNFLCPFRVEGHLLKQQAEGHDMYNFDLREPELINQAHMIMDWSRKTTTGDKSDGKLSEEPDAQVWAQFTVEKNECNGKKCKQFSRCHYYRHREEAWRADVIVTNYHLLMAHIQVRDKTEKDLVLPAIDTLICDEAHEMEHIARGALGFTLTPSSFRRLLKYAQEVSVGKRMGSGAHHEAIRVARDEFFQPARDRHDAEQVAANGLKYGKHYTIGPEGIAVNGDGIDEIFRLTDRNMTVHEDAQAFCDLVANALARIHAGSQFRLSKSLKDPNLLDPRALVAAMGQLNTLAEYEARSLKEREEQAKNVGTKLADVDAVRLAESEAAVRTIKDLSEKVLEFAKQSDEDKAYWIDASKYNIQLNAAQINVAKALNEKLYPLVKTLVFTSATLATGGNFKYIEDTLGLVKPKTLIADSPFNYFEQSLFVTPAPGTIPDAPNSPEFDECSISMFKQIIDATGGRTLGLFTRLESMRKVAGGLRDGNDYYNGYHVLMQGDMDRNALVEAFRDDETSVLLGVKSFWQGIDVPGDALSAVVIHKLPFPVPDDPIVEAMHDRLGKAAFAKFDLPRMLMSVRQGVGRLIRRKDDVGVIVVLDRRVWTKPYGIDLCLSLPKMRPWAQDLGAIRPWLEEARARIPRT